MGGPCVRLTRLTQPAQWLRTDAAWSARVTSRCQRRGAVKIAAALVILCCWHVIYKYNAYNQAAPSPELPPSAVSLLRLSAWLRSGPAGAVSPGALRGCLRRRPRRLLFAGHSRVWQLFWAAVGRAGAELRPRWAPAHGPPYGGDRPPPGQTVPDTCVEVFRRPPGDRRPPACSWAADAPGLQLDLRWRLRLDGQLSRLLTEAATPGQTPDLLVAAVALKETVRERALQRAPQALWDAVQRHLVRPLRTLTDAGVPSVLLLDFPPNRRRAAVPYDRGAGAATLVQNALIMQAVREVPGLLVWTSPMPSVIQFYTETCGRPATQLDTETAERCANDTFHPGPDVVDGMLDQLLHLLC
ncbi:uncharacterized protein LOC122366159 [Amphibalanus amphitrite]|uniref:uncharacterized protein LOC122366159 n=1 Tax=Amphibalanus amphitrite TaxID=1232801 RepID=UPI001C922A06|nr:uncharacterized protein LOC122366159 [Amphibalanus amphitrite]